MTRLPALAAAFAVLVAGCLESTPQDQEQPPQSRAPGDIRVTVVLAPPAASPEKLPTLTVRVWNAGTSDVQMEATCPGPFPAEISVTGSRGRPVDLSADTATMGACFAPTTGPLASLDEVEVTYTLGRDVWKDLPEAPAGPYTVTASVRWSNLVSSGIADGTALLAWNADADAEGPHDPDGGHDASDDHGSATVHAAVAPKSFGKGGMTRFNATATNTGTEPVYYRAGCEPPLSVRLDFQDSVVQFLPPMFSCQGFSIEALRPGQSVSVEVAWDGTLYNGEDAYEAGPGTYTFVGQFSYARSDDSEAERISVGAWAEVEYRG